MKLLSVFTIGVLVLTFTIGCVYDPVNYNKQHDRDFNDHLAQMGGNE